MKLLAHLSFEDRLNLVDYEATWKELQIDAKTLSKYSCLEVVARCVVCSILFKKQFKAITTGKGLTCSLTCSKQFKLFKQAEGKKNLSEERKEEIKKKHKQAIEKFKNDLEKVEKKKQKTKQTNLEKYGVENPLQNQEVKEKLKSSLKETYQHSKDQILEKRKQTMLERHGWENPFEALDFQQSLIALNQERYGVSFYVQHPEFKEKSKNTLLENYQVENPALSPTLMEKKKKSCLEKYGVENPRQSLEVEEKIYKTCEERYGVRVLLKDLKFRAIGKQTMIEKYGVENPGQIKGHQAKIKATMLERYGVENFKQLEGERNRLKEWCEENPERLFKSKGEEEILNWVREFYPNARKHKENGHEIDIFIPEINIGIEYNGLYWHSEEKKPRNYHLEKTLYYQSKQIRIIHIWEHWWKERKQQVKSFLRSALKLNQNKIAARKCKVIFSNDKEEIKKSHDLLEKTHIQGKPHATKFVANVYYGGDLLATASFALHHRTSKDLVLTRFTTKENYTIQGILSKISNLASNNLKSKIISWADFAISDGNGYEKAGWQMEEKLPIDYFYYHPKTGLVVSKQSRQKKLINTPKEMTELEHALLDGLVRVWDCGKIRFGY